jgi:hypothetical protein
MNLTLKSARDPSWSNAEHSAIDLLVIFNETAPIIGETPFTARPDDIEPHGVLLFEKASAGEFGEVAPYQPPSAEVLAAQALEERSRRMALATARIAPLQDAVDLEEATVEEIVALRAWKAYRVELNRIDQQDSYPQSISWPVRPDEALTTEIA